MKVFTVGLDQKPPLEESKSPPSPPPGYVTPPASVIMGSPEQSHSLPIIIRKSRGYKGVLVVLLSVFLIALFALTLSEIAYNRQRDENFFRLRWAELKHRMGWGNYDNPHRWQEQVYNLHRVPEFNQPPISALQAQPIIPIVANTEPPKIEKPIDDAEKKVNIADRLQFFRQLLEGIKKQAENMGFDGTMQVSVIQVDPLMAENEHDPKSESFLNGFGEVHQAQHQQEKSGSESNEKEMKLRRPCGFFKCEDSGDEMPNFQLPRMGPFRPDWMRPKNFEAEDNQVGNFFPKVEMIEIPVDQQEVGTMYGRKFGRLLQEIIANRLRNFQQMNFPQRPENTPSMQALSWWQPMRSQFPQSFPIGNGVEFNELPNPRPFFNHQQQQTPPPFIFFPNPQPNHFSRNRMENIPILPDQQNVAPENRIQIEPPNQRFNWKPEFLFSTHENEHGNGFVNLINEVNRGWTHQEQNPKVDSVEEQLPQQPALGPNKPGVEPRLQQPRPVHDEETGKKEKPEKQKHEEENRPIPILAIDPPMPSFNFHTPDQPKPQVDFPAVKFPMNDENGMNNMNQREHNPLFFQVDEPIGQQEQQPVE